jgi:hypothetical protein
MKLSITFCLNSKPPLFPLLGKEGTNKTNLRIATFAGMVLLK